MRVFLMLLLALGPATLLPRDASATAISTNSTFYFAGACSDCVGTGRAELVLANYTLGTAISSSNFLSFHYDGTNLLAPFTITASSSNSYSGAIAGPLPAAENIFISAPGAVFVTDVGGSWCVGRSCLADFGQTSIWSDTAPPAGVPEPFSLSLLLAGLAGTALTLRRPIGSGLR